MTLWIKELCDFQTDNTNRLWSGLAGGDCRPTTTAFCSLHCETTDHLLTGCGGIAAWRGLQACTPTLGCEFGPWWIEKHEGIQRLCPVDSLDNLDFFFDMVSSEKA